MLTPEESALLLDINQRLRKLHTQKAEAQRVRDRARADALQVQIDELTEDCDRVLDAADAA
jgi:hypothetical protein